MLRHPLPICFRMPFRTSASHVSNLRCAVEWYEKLLLPPAVPYVSVEHCLLLFWALSMRGLDSANYFTYFFWCLGNSRELDRHEVGQAVGCRPCWGCSVLLTCRWVHGDLTLPHGSSPLPPPPLSPVDTMGITVLLQSPLKSPGEGDIIKDMIRQPYHKTGAVLLVIHFTLVLEV